MVYHTNYLLIKADCVQPLIHDVHPAVLGGEHEEGHEGLAQVVEVVLVVDPAVAIGAEFQALRLVLHQLRVRALAVIKYAFEELQAKSHNPLKRPSQLRF